MKPTQKQKAVILNIMAVLDIWHGSNDISSPTHYVEDEEWLKAELSEELTDEQLSATIDKVTELFDFIKNLK